MHSITCLSLLFSISVVIFLPSASFASPPEQGHLALLPAASSGVSVTWVQQNSSNGYVKYGTSASNLNMHSIPATSKTYSIKDMCGSPANETSKFVNPGNILMVPLSNLINGQIYYYSFGSNDSNTGFSPVYNFHFGPKSNSTTTFIGYGDMGAASIGKNSTRVILENIDDVDIIMHVGDISYAMGNEHIWGDWFNMIEPVTTKVPYHVCLGNHEYDWPTQSFKPLLFTYRKDSGGECGIPYDRRFNMPGPELKSKDFLTGSRNIYHSVNVGMVHFIMLSSEHNMTKGSEQYIWLENDLKSVDRKVHPWIVFGQHRPYYGTTIVRVIPEYGIMRKILEPLFVKYKVDLVMFGHIHQYQRTCRMVNHKCDNAGPVYNVIGSAGATYQVPFLWKPKWMKFRSDDFGISKFKAWNHTHMEVKWFNDRNDTISDEYWIIREA